MIILHKSIFLILSILCVLITQEMAVKPVCGDKAFIVSVISTSYAKRTNLLQNNVRKGFISLVT